MLVAGGNTAAGLLHIHGRLPHMTGIFLSLPGNLRDGGVELLDGGGLLGGA
ncbi:hypothetical protein SDC9_98781 [bioreactor metagenome]|uniref:Uncharacterized protein n=1 Tax=bioreactor metagenome TaxID=1076179 RepID=A0A645AH52_9ZZZZ